jgi:hypothetical protein
VVFLCDLEIIIKKADKSETCQGDNHDPDIHILQVSPQENGKEYTEDDKNSSHRRCACLVHMRLRSIIADLLCHTQSPHSPNEPWSQEERKKHSSKHSKGGPECDVSENIQRRKPVMQIV